MQDTPFSVLDTLADFVQGLPVWLLALVGALLLALPIGLAQLIGVLEVLNLDILRQLLLPPAIIVYTLAMAPLLRRSGLRVAQGMRPLLEIDDVTFDKLVAEGLKIRLRAELIAFAIGAMAGIAVWEPWSGRDSSLGILLVYYLISSIFMFGLMGWIIYLALARTRLTAALHRQSLQVDIFDLTHFEPVGRQSLLLALIFIGGTTLSLVFTLAGDSFLNWQNLFVYGTLVVVIVLVFFLNMRHTHRILSAVKRQELAAAEQNINRAYRRLQKYTEQGRDTAEVAAEINAWATMEQRLKLTRTWPYNTEMLRTLAVSVLTPIAVGVSRVVVVLLANDVP